MPMSELTNNIIMHQRPQVFTRKEYTSNSPQVKEVKDDHIESIKNLRSSLDQNFGRIALESVQTSLGIAENGQDEIHIPNSFRKDESMTTFTTTKRGPRLTKHDVS
jgi:hypothetical protein